LGLLINFGDVILKHASLVAISVMVPHPIAHVVVATGLIAALRREVEIVISTDQYVLGYRFSFRMFLSARS
jgi:hypothetical protein